jgi:hypothetical protein
METGTHQVCLSFLHFRLELTIGVESRKNTICMGDKTSCERVRAGYQRLGYPVLSDLPLCVYRYAQFFVTCYRGLLTLVVDADPENYDPASLPPHILNAIEADSFWCLSRLLDGIQDNYISQQPGIHRSVKRMAELVKRIDGGYPCPIFFVRLLTSWFGLKLRWLRISSPRVSSLCSLRLGG